MKYSSLILAAALTLSVAAQAGDDDAASVPKVAMKPAQFSEFRAECIEQGISDDLETDQLKSFVDYCISEKSAGREPASGGGGD